MNTTNKLDENIKSIQDQLDESIDTEKMNLEEYRTYKKQLIGKECREKIHSGIDFEINGTIEHFTYNADDQINFIDVKVMCDSGFPVIPYHESSGNTNTNPCKFYPAEDMGKVYMRLVLSTLYSWEDYADAILRVYNDKICRTIDNYNGSAYYEPSYYLTRCYYSGTFN